MANNNAPISEEVVAAITAAVEMMVGHKVMAVRIKRSDAWVMQNILQKMVAVLVFSMLH